MADIGKYAFLAGLALAVIMAFVAIPSGALILMVLGLVVGFLNVANEESQRFLIAAIGLSISATAVAAMPGVGDILTAVAMNAVAFISPAVLVVAVKALLETAKD